MARFKGINSSVNQTKKNVVQNISPKKQTSKNQSADTGKPRVSSEKHFLKVLQDNVVKQIQQDFAEANLVDVSINSKKEQIGKAVGKIVSEHSDKKVSVKVKGDSKRKKHKQLTSSSDGQTVIMKFRDDREKSKSNKLKKSSSKKKTANERKNRGISKSKPKKQIKEGNDDILTKLQKGLSAIQTKPDQGESDSSSQLSSLVRSDPESIVKLKRKSRRKHPQQKLPRKPSDKGVFRTASQKKATSNSREHTTFQQQQKGKPSSKEPSRLETKEEPETLLLMLKEDPSLMTPLKEKLHHHRSKPKLQGKSSSRDISHPVLEKKNNKKQKQPTSQNPHQRDKIKEASNETESSESEEGSALQLLMFKEDFEMIPGQNKHKDQKPSQQKVQIKPSSIDTSRAASQKRNKNLQQQPSSHSSQQPNEQQSKPLDTSYPSPQEEPKPLLENKKQTPELLLNLKNKDSQQQQKFKNKHPSTVTSHPQVRRRNEGILKPHKADSGKLKIKVKSWSDQRSPPKQNIHSSNTGKSRSQSKGESEAGKLKSVFHQLGDLVTKAKESESRSSSQYQQTKKHKQPGKAHRFPKLLKVKVSGSSSLGKSEQTGKRNAEKSKNRKQVLKLGKRSSRVSKKRQTLSQSKESQKPEEASQPPALTTSEAKQSSSSSSQSRTQKHPEWTAQPQKQLLQEGFNEEPSLLITQKSKRQTQSSLKKSPSSKRALHARKLPKKMPLSKPLVTPLLRKQTPHSQTPREHKGPRRKQTPIKGKLQVVQQVKSSPQQKSVMFQKKPSPRKQLPKVLLQHTPQDEESGLQLKPLEKSLGQNTPLISQSKQQQQKQLAIPLVKQTSSEQKTQLTVKQKTPTPSQQKLTDKSQNREKGPPLQRRQEQQKPPIAQQASKKDASSLQKPSARVLRKPRTTSRVKPVPSQQTQQSASQQKQPLRGREKQNTIGQVQKQMHPQTRTPNLVVFRSPSTIQPREKKPQKQEYLQGHRQMRPMPRPAFTSKFRLKSQKPALDAEPVGEDDPFLRYVLARLELQARSLSPRKQLGHGGRVWNQTQSQQQQKPGQAQQRRPHKPTPRSRDQSKQSRKQLSAPTLLQNQQVTTNRRNFNPQRMKKVQNSKQ